MSQKKLGTILSYLNIIVSNTISLIYTPYMLRMLGQSEYGLYGTANSFISYLSILSFGIGGAYIRFNAKCRANNDKEEEKRLNGMFLTIFSMMSIFVLIGGIIFIVLAGSLVKNTFTAEELFKLRVLMLIMTMSMILTFVFNVVTMALQAYEKFAFIRGVLLLSGIVTPIINAVAMHLGGKVITISLISLGISFTVYIIYFIYAWNKIVLRFSFRGFNKEVMKEIFTFSGFLFLNSITDTITFSTDSMVLSSVKGSAAVAIYTVGANFKNYFQNFSSSISAVFAPQVNQIVAQNKDSDELNEIFIRVGRVQFYVVSLIMIGYIFIGQDFIMLWAGKGYEEAFMIGLLLMLAVFVPAFQNVGIEIQKAKNMHKARSVVYFFIALINVIITIPLSKYWGGIGAALATMICMFFGTVIFMNYYYWKHVKLDMRRFWKSIASILPGYVLPISAGFIINSYFKINSYYGILISAFIIVVIFSVSVWFISMNEFEKNLFRGPVIRIWKKLHSRSK